MNNKKIKKRAIVVAGTLSTLLIHSSAMAWSQPNRVSRAYEQNKVKDQVDLRNVDLMTILEQGRANLNEDVGLLEIQLTAKEARTSPVIQLTRNEPVLMAVEDGQHGIAVIQAISSQRHSDGSATVRQKTISPSDFNRQSSGGMLTDMQYRTFIEAYGGFNPMSLFGKLNDHGDHVWYNSKPHEIQTVMGVLMKHLGATHGYYVLLEPQVESWKTTKKKSGGLRKEVTTHVEAHMTPHWSMLLPVDIGVGYGGEPNPAFFQFRHGGNTYAMHGGVNVLAVGPTHDFNVSKEHIFYDKRSKTGWTGFALVLASIAIGALTGGAGLIGSLGPLGGAAIGGGAALSGLTLSGAELHQPVANDFGDLLVKSSVAGIDTRKRDLTSGTGEWHAKWRTNLQAIVKGGPLNTPNMCRNNRDSSSRECRFSENMRRELVQWDRIVKPK